MKTGFRGTYVISWSQTDIDGLGAAPVQSLRVGTAWSWRGDAIRVDGPSGVLQLDEADGAENLRKSAARMVHKLVGAAMDGDSSAIHHKSQSDDPLMDSSFVVTDGAQSYTITVIEVGRGSQPLLMFMDEIPPRNCDMWVVHHTLSAVNGDATGPNTGGVICFTPGTRISTPEGNRAIEELREGDWVQTKDNGAQQIGWVGSRRMTGARLFAMPKLRPVRFQAGALGIDRPDEALLVSPEHRMLIQGDVARALFNTQEVLVRAQDLINGTTVTLAKNIREVTYIHILFENHQVLWANGMETESFHPASSALRTLGDEDRKRLLRAYPDLEFDPHTYGSFARRILSTSEAAILNHAA